MNNKDKQQYERVESFDDCGFSEELLRGIYGFGFERPSEVQQKSLLPLIRGRDLIITSQAGAGKTAAMVMGVLNKIDPKSSSLQALVLTPTRQLSQGIAYLFHQIGSYMKINCHNFFTSAASNPRKQLELLKDGNFQMLVGTPGRTLNFIQKNILDLDQLKIIVFEELQEILCRGFSDQLKEITEFVPADAQVAVFSSQNTSETLSCIKNRLKNPVTILVKIPDKTLEGIRQYCVTLEDPECKPEVLVDLLNNFEITQCVIYTNQTKTAQEIGDLLRTKRFNASVMSQDKTQSEAEIHQFIIGATRLLITTDLLKTYGDRASISSCGLVINYDLPSSKEDYLDRLGRSGHYGRRGTGITLITPSQLDQVQKLKAYYNTFIEELPIDLSSIYQ